MKITVVVLLLLVTYVSADCGCLKCSRHLQGVDVPGPDGFPVKVIFRRPKPKSGCGCSCGCGAPSEPPSKKMAELFNLGTPGKQYTATIQLPIPKMPKPRLPLKNLKYRTDTILVPPPPPPVAATPAAPAIVNPSSLTTTDILNWLRSIQLAYQLSPQQVQQQPQGPDVPQVPAVAQVPTAPQISTVEQQYSSLIPQLTVETVPCACQQCQGNPLIRTFNSENHQISKRNVPPPEMLPCINCQKPKRSCAAQKEDTFKSQKNHKGPTTSTPLQRSKRDLANKSYDFFMNMLPQSLRDPLHHSVQGTQYLKQLKPKPTLKQTLDKLMSKKTAGLGFNQHLPHSQYQLPQPKNIFNQPMTNAFGQKTFQKPNFMKSSFLDQPTTFMTPSPLSGIKYGSTDSLLGPTQTFGIKKFPDLSKLTPKDPLENLKLSTFKSQPDPKLFFGKTKAPIGSPLPLNTVDPSLENTYRKLIAKYDSSTSQIGAPNLSIRSERNEAVDEKTLLKKLKKLNNNPYTSNLEDQATAFMQQLLRPGASKRRHARASECSPEKELSRKKRTIILGSDELDLPPHYAVEMVSVEDNSKENQYGEIYPFEEFEEEEEDPVVGVSPFMRRFATSQKYYPSLPSLQPKPEIVLGKNVIQKAVREELEAHHRKVEREQKVKEMKDNLKRKKHESMVPRNPIFALLTAPVKFLKHFSDMNRGATPVMATIPKLVYTTKKVFRDLGKNFQRNCLDLASNVIGDFDHVHPNVIEQIIQPDGRRYRRDVVQEFKKCLDENHENRAGNNKRNNRRRNRKCKNKISKQNTASKAEDRAISQSSQIKLETLDQTNKTKSLLEPEQQANIKSVTKENSMFSSNGKNPFKSKSAENNTESIESNQKETRLPSSSDFENNNTEIMDQTSKTGNDIEKMKHFAPTYTVAFENSKETSNFREVPDKHVRKKRYVVRVVDEDEIQDQVEDYLTQKLGDQYEYHNPLQGYYDKVNGFLSKLYSSHQPLCKIGDECYYQRSAPAEETYLPDEETYYDDEPDSLLESYEDSFEEKTNKKQIQIKKMKPKVIIDKKGRPFMEYNGYKRPLMLHGKKFGILKNTGQSYGRGDTSSEETGNRIATLIARAKTDSEVVGSNRKDIIPHQMVKERISSLLEEIDQLVHLNAENYDDIFEDLIKIQHIKTSIEQDWKRMLIEERSNDIAAKIDLLSKLKELQHVKNSSVRKIAAALKKNDNEFVRCQLVNSLIELQKLQCLILSVVEDFEQHLKMRTPCNTKKEIKYVDYLSGLKFAFAKTRNDLIKMLSKDRDKEGLKYMEMLHKLKKLLISADENPEKFDQAAKLLWEMKNLEKMQIETIKEINIKLGRNYKIKKELKIIFDLQKRFEDCNKELSELLSDIHVKATANAIGQKKDIKKVIEEVKKRHEEMLQKAKEKSSSLLKKS